MSDIYEPSDDSYLMSETLRKELPEMLKLNSKLKFLEIGCGSGINLITAKTAGVNVRDITGSDISIRAGEHCIKLGFTCILSDLFSNINGKFDVIAFNPPYLPIDKEEPKDSRRETTGGKKGNELAVKFLEQAGEHLAKGGKIFVITSSLSQDIDFSSLGYKATEIAGKKLFFEKLSLWECLKI